MLRQIVAIFLNDNPGKLRKFPSILAARSLKNIEKTVNQLLILVDFVQLI